MKNVYVVICETAFAEKRNGHSGEFWVQDVFEDREDAVNFINEEYTENSGPDESGNEYIFTLDGPIVGEKSGEHYAETGDTMTIHIIKSDYCEKKGS